MLTLRSTILATIALIAGVICGGCAIVPLPAIDPSGERIFLPSPSYTTLVSPHDSVGQIPCFPRPAFTEPPPIPPCGTAGPLHPGAIGTGVPVPRPDRLILTPAKIVAPVNSEVVLLAGLCGREGYLVTKQPVEWMLSPDSVGNIIALADSDRDHLAKLIHHSSRKDGNNLAITRTSTAAHVVTRGTPLPSDDVRVGKGQTWISVSSPTEGVSYVTALAKSADNWETRRQTAMVYWVDLQWAFPAPQIVCAGQPCQLETVVTKTSTGGPAVNAVVTYEVVGGAPAYFASGRTSIRVPSDETGRAITRLVQEPPGPGTTQVRVQVLSNQSGTSGAQAVLGQGFTTITWSAPGLVTRVEGPQIVARGGIASYRIEVSNPGDIPTRAVGLQVDLPPSLRFLNGQPTARVLGNRLEWPLGDLAPRAVQTVQINCQATNSGDFQLTARAISPDVATESVSGTQVRVVESGISVRFVDPPATAVTGSKVAFNFEVTNVGGIPINNVVVRDTFDSGLQPDYSVDPNRPFEKSIGTLRAGETQPHSVAFVARGAGRLCHVLEVTADGGHTASVRACVDVTQPVLKVNVRKVGPEQAFVGEKVRFVIRVTNSGEGVLTNLQIADYPDASLQPDQGTLGLERIDQGVLWKAGTLGPGQDLTREIVCICQQVSPSAQNQVEVTADGGVREAAVARIAIQPRVEAKPAVPAVPPPATPERGKLGLSVAHTGDANVGGTASFIIVINNLSDQPDQNVVVSISLPPEFGAPKVEQVTRFPVTVGAGGLNISIPEIRGMETLPGIRIDTAAKKAGSYKVRVRLESRRTEPVEETTEINIVPR